MGSVYGWLFMAVGAFTILGAAANWEWFMNGRRAQFFLWLFGRDGARVVYFLLGLAFAAYGLAILTGLAPVPTRRHR